MSDRSNHAPRAVLPAEQYGFYDAIDPSGFINWLDKQVAPAKAEQQDQAGSMDSGAGMDNSSNGAGGPIASLLFMRPGTDGFFAGLGGARGYCF